MSDRIAGVRRLATIAGGLTAGVVFARYVLAGEGRPPLLFRIAARAVLRDVDLPIGWILKSADRHYAELLPKVVRAATVPGRANLRMSAYALAIYRAMREEGVTEEWAAELVANGLFRVMRTVWRAPDAIVMRLRPNDRVARARLRERIARRVFYRSPDWEMREVAAASGFGVDVTRCVMRDFLAAEGASKFCENVLCRQDALMASSRGEVLTRTTTLAGGGERCNFRFA